MLTLFSFWAFVQRPHLLTLLLVLLGVSAWGQSASAATLNVPGQYPNIQVAVNAAANGDTVLIADGTYSGAGNRDIDFGGKNLTVTSQHGAASTIIDCGGSSSANHRGFYIHSGETGAVISGLTVKNGYESSSAGGGVYGGNLTNCIISGNFSGGNGGGVYGGALKNCTISGNTSVATGGGSGGGGVYGGTLTGCTVSGNSASGNGGGVFIQYLGALTNCLLVGNTASTGGGVYSNIGTMTNCTVTGNMALNGGGFYNNRYASQVTNCIFYGDTGGEIGSLIDTVFLDHCDVQGGYSGGRITGNSPLIDADPLFVNALTDLHLQSGSPCIGAGTSSGAPTTDKDGKTRPSPPTIGAYEGVEGVAGGHTHLLWNNSDGRVMLWSVAADGTFTLNGFGPYTDNAPQNKWSATAVATGADGKSHLLWNNTDGRVMLWTVDDSGSFTLAGYGPYTDDSVGNDPSVNKWSATAVSVGPDGTVHLLWNNTDHRAMLWNVGADFSFTLAGYGPYTDNSVSNDPGNLWSATALAIGPDNISRIAWNNVDGRVMLWKVDSAFSFTLAGYGPYTDNAPQNKWSAVGVSVGPDNLTHLLWSNTDRRAMFWNVGADFSFTLAGYGPYTDNAPNNLWTATAVATGPDGLSHILWGNTDYRAMLWGVDNAFNFTVAGYGPYTDNAPQNLWSVTAVSAGP